ncbi:hypothetical protein [Polynucleobacter sp.]|uniref:hypothetical protein n=1 Tax=Polynucleobacter sp. TaxID=2029855 RepID=UPI003F696327
MDDLEQKKISHVEIILNKFKECIMGNSSEFQFSKEYAQAIILSLKKFDHEPLEVEIVKLNERFFEVKLFEPEWESDCRLDCFDTYEEALAFCEKKGLKVLNEIQNNR